MINKNDPLIGAVSKIMEQNDLRREVEKKLCEELGVFSRNALPHEHLANYDALLEQRLAEAGRVLPDLTQKEPEKKHSKEYAQRMKDASDKRKSSKAERSAAATFAYKMWGKKADQKKKVDEALHPNQQKLDVHEPEKDKLTAQDFKMLRAKKTMKEEEQLDETSKKKAWIHAMDAKDQIATIRAKAGKPEYDYTDKGLSDKDKNTIRKRTAGLIRIAKKLTSEEMQDGKNPLPPASARERIQNKLGTGPKSQTPSTPSSDSTTRSQPSDAEKDAVKSKIENLDEKKLTDAEMAKHEELAKKMEKGDWSDRYGKRGKEVMYATATKMAKKLAEDSVNIDSVMEEIARNLGEAKMRQVMEEPDDTASPEDRAAARPSNTARMAPGAMTGGSFRPEAPSTGGAGNRLAPSMSMQPNNGLSPVGSSVGKPAEPRPAAPAKSPTSMQPSSSPVAARKGEGATGQALASFGVSRDQRRNQDFVTKTLGNDPATGKAYVAGSAAANLALKAKFSKAAGDRQGSDAPVGAAARPIARPATARPAPIPPRRPATGLRESLEHTIRKMQEND